MRRHARIPGALALTALVLAAGCGTAPPDTRPGMPQPVTPPPALPDDDGWGVHVLAFVETPRRAAWVGTWDGSLYTVPPRGGQWRRVPVADEATGPVNSIAFERDTAVVWYGTAGAGFARSADGGATWRAWPRSPDAAWNHVVPRGIVVVRDTVFVATTDGLRYTGDGGLTWRCVQGPSGPTDSSVADGCDERWETLPTSHLLSLEVMSDGTIYIGHLQGLSRSADRGRTWSHETESGLAGKRVRSVRVGRHSGVWALTETTIYADSPRVEGFHEIPLRVPGFATLPGGPRALITRPGVIDATLPGELTSLMPVLVATSYGMLGETAAGDFRLYFLSAADRYRPAGDIWTGAWWGPPFIPVGGSAAGLSRVLAGEAPVPMFLDAPDRVQPTAGRSLGLARPVRDDEGNPFADGTVLFGAPPTIRPDADVVHAVRYHNPPGTPVRAAATGTVIRAGAGGVLLRHDGLVEGHVVHTSYVAGGATTVSVGQRVAAGDELARVGRGAGPTGVAFGVHAVLPADTATFAATTSLSTSAVNPQLWVTPREGTGVVAGRVFNSAGQPVPGAVVRGLVVTYPTEAPFSYVRTYEAGVSNSPGFDEHFAVGDVPAGDYTLGVVIDGVRTWRRVRVAPGQVSMVEFRP
ncbi:MAG TPA: peptidoglycan DD-metalloendopeptidase family protein [Longimicrobiales bacterium]|nr:peptidoglycan DD-metalloendopeptidase family protein [Longimicrobiales bacterium]